jgi:serine/threonine-protein kinase
MAESGEDLLAHMSNAIQETGHIDYRSPDGALLFTAGDIIAEKYQIIQLLNRGSMGVVYQAKHLLLDKVVAIKVMTLDKPLEESARQRFMLEARATAALGHPNIVSVYDCGVLENGALYLVMEYLEGETLASRLQKKQRLDFDLALPIIRQVCMALDYAHAQGVVHRDLKPSNIMLVQDYKNEDQTIVIDFSIAKFTRKKPNQKTLTKPGQIFGSPLYMSPEQCQGKKPDHRSDIYSLGCVIYEILCGAPPLAGDSMLATIYKHVNEQPTPFTEYVKDNSLPKELQAIILKTLAKLPENRYQSVNELLEAFENVSKQPQKKLNEPIISSSSLKRLTKIFASVIIPLLLLAALFVVLASGVHH